MSRTTFTAMSWTNSIGQTINPGDPVLYVATGYNHSITIKTGIFDGVYTDYRNKIAGVRVGGVADKRYTWTGSDYVQKDVVRKAILPQMRVFKLVENVKTSEFVKMLNDVM